jgi:hypothetical protein
MSATIIGVDPHKRSHTAVVLDEAEQIAAKLRVDAGPGQVDALLGWAPGGERVWAIENVNGLGHLLAQQLIGRGEVVIDVTATLSSRARKLLGHSARKTDEHDARSVVIAAAHNNRLRRSCWGCCWTAAGTSSRSGSAPSVNCMHCSASSCPPARPGT